jgi:putative membrane protein
VTYGDAMPVIALVLAGLAALLHVWFFVLESVLFRRPFAHRTFGVTDPAEVEVLAFPMLNQGFYNLFLAIGTLVGIVGVSVGWDPQGTTLMVFGCLFMVGAALVLVIARPRMARAAAIQGVFPLVAVLAVLVS